MMYENKILILLCKDYFRLQFHYSNLTFLMDPKFTTERTLSILRKGGIILYPTDTIWGLGGDATNALAVQKIYELKKREEKKSMIILVSEEAMIYDYVSHPSNELLEYLAAQSYPTTAIFTNAINLPESLINEDGSIAIRIVQDDFCRTLIQELNKPLVSTSANISGGKYPQNFQEITDEIKNGVEHIAQHRQNDLIKYTPSSIIKLDENGSIIHLR